MDQSPRTLFVLPMHRGLAAILFLSAAVLAVTEDCLTQFIQERHKNHYFCCIILNLEFEKKPNKPVIVPITKQQCFNIQVAVVGGEVNFKNQGQVIAIKNFFLKRLYNWFFSSRICFIKLTLLQSLIRNIIHFKARKSYCSQVL